MPFAFIIVGLVMVAAGVRGTSKDLVTLLKGDLTGKGNYLYWLVSILVIGAIGYSDTFKPLSRAFLVLVVIVLVLSNGGFFQLFNQALATISTQNTATTVASNNSSASTAGIVSAATSALSLME